MMASALCTSFSRRWIRQVRRHWVFLRLAAAMRCTCACRACVSLRLCDGLAAALAAALVLDLIFLAGAIAGTGAIGRCLHFGQGRGVLGVDPRVAAAEQSNIAMMFV